MALRTWSNESDCILGSELHLAYTCIFLCCDLLPFSLRKIYTIVHWTPTLACLGIFRLGGKITRVPGPLICHLIQSTLWAPQECNIVNICPLPPSSLPRSPPRNQVFICFIAHDERKPQQVSYSSAHFKLYTCTFPGTFPNTLSESFLLELIRCWVDFANRQQRDQRPGVHQVVVVVGLLLVYRASLSVITWNRRLGHWSWCSASKSLNRVISLSVWHLISHSKNRPSHSEETRCIKLEQQ